MAWDYVIGLIGVTEGKNEIGRSIDVRLPPKEIYANRKSIRQNEFYQAAANGLKPELMFEIWSFEYSGEQLITYDGKEYRIIRTFEKENDIIEIVCSGLVNEVG